MLYVTLDPVSNATLMSGIPTHTNNALYMDSIQIIVCPTVTRLCRFGFLTVYLGQLLLGFLNTMLLLGLFRR